MLPVLSPDGKRVLALAGAAGDRNRQDIWLHHGDRRTKTRLTFGNAIYDRPTWHPDGVRFAFSAGAPGKYKLYEQSTVATGEALPITKSPVGDFAFSWSSDGTYLLFDRFQGTGRFSDIWYLRREAGGATEEFPFIRTEFDELSPQFSHDGMYVAYESDRSGRYEVYVTTFPSRDREWQVSTNGGRQPRWRRDGRELFYVEDGAWMVSVPVTPSPVFKAGKPERLFYQENLNARGHRYDVTPTDSGLRS